MNLCTANKKRCSLFFHFFISYKKSLAIGIAFSISALILWCYWNQYQHNNDVMIKESYTWRQLHTALNKKTADSRLLNIVQYYSNIKSNNYDAFVSMDLARRFIEKGDFLKAENQLKKSLIQTRDSNLQSLIRLRLARLQLEQKHINSALKTLTKIKGEGWIALVADIYGDIQSIKGNNKEARAAYKQALCSGALKMLVRIKLDNLPS
ncbi:hypothetical protein A35E_00463 [secondary endosymbiont of Heteropsylla cubana]|uniref:Ancillary SecYEG translocon subunit n=1 Tax=secondary endosymbiont of Heteropsylla cubana TaxID=134287 RepID=J3TZ61_9ENTR|nr:tetratricopeptide repeat protein [secondary endosymbiont of Heteropsylla cubana]AFP85755.1 hypothetical protein A35E_00463 [secondary endosymbiont of Heteropsylla cubana]